MDKVIWRKSKKTFPQELKTKKQRLRDQRLKHKIVLGLQPLKTQKSRNPITKIKIRLASPEQIKEWCSRLLPNKSSIGEIKSAQTVDYKTLDPKEDGLFCERIFGPVNDFQCFCDRKKSDRKRNKRVKDNVRAKNGKVFCRICDVEIAFARVRRYNLGYIQLVSPVTHIWFLKGRISYISILLGYKRKYLEELTLCKRVLEFTKNLTKNSFLFLPTFFKEKTTYNKVYLKKEKDNKRFLYLNNRIRFSNKEEGSAPFLVKKGVINDIVHNDTSYKFYHCKTSFKDYQKSAKFVRKKQKSLFTEKSKNAQNLPLDPYTPEGYRILTPIPLYPGGVPGTGYRVPGTGYRTPLYQTPSGVLDTPAVSVNSKEITGDIESSYSNLCKVFGFIKTKKGGKKRNLFLIREILNVCAKKDNRNNKGSSLSLHGMKRGLRRSLSANMSPSIKKLYKKPIAVLLFSFKKTRGTGPEVDPKTLSFAPKGFKNNTFGDFVQEKDTTRISFPTKRERIVKTFFQPTICPFLPEIIQQVMDRRLDLKRVFYADDYYNPIWGDRAILMFFTLLPETGDIPIPEYSQLTGYSENRFLQDEFSLSAPLFHQKQVVNTGGFVIKEMLNGLNLNLLGKVLKRIISKTQRKINHTRDLPSPTRREQRRLRRLKIYHFKKVRRAKICRDFLNSEVRPEWMTLSTIPVIPPELRPIIRLDGDTLAVSDLNKIYQTIFYRNRSIINSSLLYKEECLRKQVLLQKAVNALIDNGKGGKDTMCALNGRPLKSLSDILKGKKGRFRLTLLGKRVDYSGRSVIVVGPTLLVHQCGIPKEMAIELFKPFLIRYLLRNKKAQTIVAAKGFMAKRNVGLWRLLEKVMRKHFVFLNRAPTLHRLGIQGFQPKLVNGRAILLHPLVCTAFNADFDGDQMAVHIPLSLKAQVEARILMSPLKNILSPATGQPILVPSQDMILGCNYLTYLNLLPKKNDTEKITRSLPILTEEPVGKEQDIVSFPSNTEHTPGKEAGPIRNSLINLRGFESLFSISSHTNKERYFSDFNDLLQAYYQKEIDLHAPVWVKTKLSIETENRSLSPLEMRISSSGEYNQLFSTFQLYYNRNDQKVKQYLFTTPGRVLVNQIFFG